MRLLIMVCGLFLHTLLASNVYADIQSISAHSAESVFDNDRALDISQGAIGNQLGDYSLTNADGDPVSLSDFHGKPLVLSMIYTSCYHICPMTTRHLSKVVQKARNALGDDSFSVAVIGFDTQVDTPAAMQYFANKQGISDKGWNLLSITEDDVKRLSKNIGFQYFPSSNGFDHLIQATIIDAEGKVYRQVYGQVFDTPLLIDPLIELVLGRSPPEQSLLADLTRKIKLFCTTYDPVRDGYYFDYSLFLGVLIGGSIIAFTGTVVVRGLHKA
jgi:protein SCO1/2